MGPQDVEKKIENEEKSCSALAVEPKVDLQSMSGSAIGRRLKAHPLDWKFNGSKHDFPFILPRSILFSLFVFILFSYKRMKTNEKRRSEENERLSLLKKRTKLI